MKRSLLLFICFCCFCTVVSAQGYTAAELRTLRVYQDSLASLGRKMVNDANELERKNANYSFIRLMVSALKVNNSYQFGFDSLKIISIQRSPDNKFRILSWSVMNNDGSYRFYGAIQMNTGGKLLLHPLEDYSPLLKNPQDSVVDNRKWYGAMYYKIISVMNAPVPYYVLLGWKGNTVKSTKKVIEVLSFKNDKPVFGMPVFMQGTKSPQRVIFEYSRQASMLLRYVPEQNLIVLDHLASPDGKKNDPTTYGPDLSYDSYRLVNGKWHLKENIDMRNIPSPTDVDLPDPKKQAVKDRATIPSRRN